MAEKTNLTLKHADFRQDINCAKHHTDMYRVMYASNQHGEDSDACMVVRRGQEMVIDCELSDNFNRDKYKCCVCFQFLNMESKPVVSWPSKIQIHEKDSRRVRFIVNIPPDAPFGVYHMIITTSDRQTESSSMRAFTIRNSIYVIFNPWVSADAAFVPEENDRQNYVLAERGSMLTADVKQVIPRDFSWDQFDPDVIKTVFRLLEPVSLNLKQWADPVMVARHLADRNTAASRLDNGLLVGNWGALEDHIGPGDWPGTGDITRYYQKLQNTSAKYAQCFTFACSLVGLMRCIGIAARNIICLPSGNDFTNKGLMITMRDSNGAELPEQPTNEEGHRLYLNWNYHDFNEIFLRRDDLASTHPKYAEPDWQVIDSTAEAMRDDRTFDQSVGRKFVEASGPTPRAAVKDRNDDVFFETSVIRRYCMNSEKHIYHLEDGTTYEEFIEDASGHIIGTWDANANKFIDLKSFYKADDWFRNSKVSGRSQQVTNVGKFKLEDGEVPTSVTVGEVCKGKTEIVSVCDKDINVKMIITGSLCSYNGKVVKTLPPIEKTVSVSAGKNAFVEWEYGPEKYALAPICSGEQLSINIAASIDGKDHKFKKIKIGLKCPPPTVTIEGADSLSVGETAKVNIKFCNPLKIPLTEAKFHISGGSAGCETVEANGGKVDVGGTAQVTTTVKAMNHHQMLVAVSFHSKEYNTESLVLPINNIKGADTLVAKLGKTCQEIDAPSTEATITDVNTAMF